MVAKSQIFEGRLQSQREVDELVRAARIEENQMYLNDQKRHYYPASPNDPHIPLAQFKERIRELES